MSYQNQILKAIKAIPKMAGGLVAKISVTKVTGQAYDSVTGTMVNTTAVYQFEGFADKFTDHEINALGVNSKDLKLVLLNIDNLSITVKDTVIFDSVTYNVKSVEPQYVANSIGFFTIILTR
jgi:hypothetical protein